MKAVIIRYSLKESGAKEKSQIQRLLYGYKDHSNGGAYVYQRKGIMSELLHKKIDQRVILMLEKDVEEVILILEKNKANVERILVDVKKEYFL